MRGIPFAVLGYIKSDHETLKSIKLFTKVPMYKVVKRLNKKGITEIDHITQHKDSILFMFEGAYFWIYYCTDENWGIRTLLRGYSKKLTMLIYKRAKQLGYKATDDGIIFNSAVIAGKDEDQVFYLLDLEPIPIKVRFNKKKMNVIMKRLFKGDKE